MLRQTRNRSVVWTTCTNVESRTKFPTWKLLVRTKFEPSNPTVWSVLKCSRCSNVSVAAELMRQSYYVCMEDRCPSNSFAPSPTPSSAESVCQTIYDCVHPSPTCSRFTILNNNWHEWLKHVWMLLGAFVVSDSHHIMAPFNFAVILISIYACQHKAIGTKRLS